MKTKPTFCLKTKKEDCYYDDIHCSTVCQRINAERMKDNPPLIRIVNPQTGQEISLNDSVDWMVILAEKDVKIATLNARIAELETGGRSLAEMCVKKDKRITELETANSNALDKIIKSLDQISALQKENEAYRAAINTVMEWENSTNHSKYQAYYNNAIKDIQEHFKESLPFLNNPDEKA